MIESGPLLLRAAYDNRWSASARGSGHAAQRNSSLRLWHRSPMPGALTPNQLVGTEIEMREFGQMSLRRQRCRRQPLAHSQAGHFLQQGHQAGGWHRRFDAAQAAMEI
jgi:hypothetical protein